MQKYFSSKIGLK